MSEQPRSDNAGSTMQSILAALRPVALAIGRLVLLIGRGLHSLTVLTARLLRRGHAQRSGRRDARRSAEAAGEPSPPFGWAPLQKYSPYRDTFRRHRLLFALPPLVAMLIAFWVVAGTPKQYEASTALWFDNPPGQASSINDGTDLTGQTTPPAAQAQVVLNELLTTRHFRLQIGDSGPLATYLTHNNPQGFGPKALLDAVRGTGSLDDRVVAALGPSAVTTKVVGPQVLAVTLRSTSAVVAAGTLRALTAEFNAERSVAQKAQSTASLAYYREAASAAQVALATAQRRVKTYVAAHPGATPCASTKAAANSSCDLDLKTLSDSQKAASARAVDATGQLNQAKIGIATLPSSTRKILVLDAPRVPPAPIAGPKKSVLAAIAGLFAGLIISLLAIIGITGAELRTSAPTPRREEADGETPPVVAPATAAVATGSFELADFPRARVEQPVVEPPVAEPEPAPVPAPRLARAHVAGHADTLASMIDSDATFSGRIVDVRNDGTARVRRPIWTVQQDVAGGFGPPLGGLVHLAAAPGHDGAVRALRDAGEGRLAFEVEITEVRPSRSKSAEPPIPPLDPRWVGTEVTFAVGPSPSARRREQRRAATRKGGAGDDRPSDVPGKIPSVP
jgi:uncharacterized protein involved in exopolysaccharide biosynthesis